MADEDRIQDDPPPGADLSRFIVESATEYAIFATDREGRVISWNAGAERLLGYPKAEALGRDSRFIFSPEDVERGIPAREMREALRDGSVQHRRWHVRKGGGRFRADGIAMPLRDDSGGLRGFVKILRDRTDEVEGEIALRESEALYRAVAAALPGGAIFLVDRGLRYRLADGQALRDAGLAPADLEGRTLREALPPGQAERSEAHYRAALAGGSFRREHEGHGRDYVTHGVPLRGPDGEVYAALAVSYDITDRKRAEEALRESETRYRALFTSIDEGYCVIEVLLDPEGRPSDYRFLEVNPAFERHTGLRDATGKRARELVPGLEAHWFEIYGRVAETGEPVRFENEAKEMDGRWFDVYAFRLGAPDERKVAVLFTDVSARKGLERSLRHRLRELAEADRRKDEFLAMLAHELRNPLSAIHGAVRVARSPGLAEHAPQALEVIERQARTLARLIDDLLDVSRVTQGKVELKRAPVDVVAAVERAAESVRPLIERKGHEFTIRHDPGPLRVDADPTRLEQVIGNLLANAVKYTGPSGHVSVSARKEAAEAVIRVEDDGVGIPPEMLPKVFDLFTQVDPSSARSEGGLGIGLALAKRLVELHGGTISAASEPGRGSAFTVRLPLVEAVAEGPEPGRSAEVSGAGRRVLVVDDNVDTARLTARLLRASGFDARACHDGGAAIEEARGFRPEVVLLDIGLPGIDGFEVARRLRREGCCRDALIIGVSGYGDRQARERGREAGFDHHLVKPVDVEAVAELAARPGRP